VRRQLVWAAILLVLMSCALAPDARADEVLVLKDGRRIPVTRLLRRGGMVLFETARGERFSVPEGDVVSPPLSSIPEAPAAAPSPATPPAEGQVLVLKDGRRIPTTRLARRDGMVLFQTATGESFSVPEDQVVSPALETIPVLGPPAGAPSPTPSPSPETPAAPAPPAPPPAPAEPDYPPLPNRWSIDFPETPRTDSGGSLNPYHINVLKGDKPIAGNSTFLVLTGVIEAPVSARRLPVPGGVSTADPNTFEFFGRGEQAFASPRASFSVELFGGQTAFRPKTWALKATSFVNLNYIRVRERNLVTVDVRDDKSRRRQDWALEEAFGEVKLLDLSPYYDFVSVRAGIQPFVSDFRGLVFSDTNLGARLFGNFANNRWQYNVAGFDLLEKDTNSELNTFEKREQKVLVANLFRQDTFALGHTLSASFHWSNDEAPKLHYDRNGVLVRPAPVGVPRVHEVKSRYVGLAGDGHFGRVNVSHAFYYAFGDDERNVVSGEEAEIRAGLGALEVSVDKDWLRFKASALFATGDGEPLDERATGFDTIYDNSNFAGGLFSFWSRSAIALTQTKTFLKVPLSLLPSLRSNKFEGQASFVNPGLLLGGVGVDVELTPKLRGVVNANYLRFHKVETLETLLFQPNLQKNIGVDWGLGFLYRPMLNENLVVTGGLTGLLPAGGFNDIFSSTPCGTPGCGAPSRKLFDAFLVLKVTY
jgi:hypothetical protein